MDRGWWLVAIPALAVAVVAVVLPPGEVRVTETNPTPASPSVTPVPLPEHPAYEGGGDFEPLPEPGPEDWLSVHPEPGQSYAAFVRRRPRAEQRPGERLYLRPLTVEGAWVGPDPDHLGRFMSAYFGLPVTVLPVVELDLETIGHRRFEVGGIASRQLLTGDLLELLREERSGDAAALLGVTTEDLYPGEEWNFVFGQASLVHRVAAFSFARYDPVFWGEAGDDHLRLRRSLKVLAHETAHMFGVLHCTAYHCVMNGANHLAEADATPFHLCPPDLAKLAWTLGFDPVERYRRLARLYRELGLEGEAAWVERRLLAVEVPAPTPATGGGS